MNPRVLCAAAVALLPQLAFASASVCPEVLSFGACWKHIQGFYRSSEGMAARSVQERLLRLETGIDTRSIDSTIRNLLPRLSFTGLQRSGGTRASGESSPVGAMLNLPDGLPGNGVQLGLETELSPVLAAPVGHALTAAGNAARIDALEDDLGQLADKLITLTYAPRFLVPGREFRLYSDRFSALVTQVQEQLDATLAGQGKKNAVKKLGELQRKLPHKVKIRIRGEVLELLTPSDFQCQPDDNCNIDEATKAKEIAASMVTAWEVAAASDAEQSIQRVFLLQKRGLDRFADLVNNQPQLLVTGRRLLRDPLVGASATSVSLSLEGSLHNLSDFESGPGKDCRDNNGDWIGIGSKGKQCLDAFTHYVAEERMQTADRFSVGLEWADLSSVDVELPADAVSLHLPGTQLWAGSVGYGRYIDFIGTPGSSRLDTRARYEYFDNDSLRGCRWIVSLVLTQKLLGASVPFTLLYKSGGEFEIEPSDQIQVLFGLKFDVLSAPTGTVASAVEVVPVLETLPLPGTLVAP